MKDLTKISEATFDEVAKRDTFKGHRRCIICGNTNCLQTAHYIGRGQGGYGIPENLVTLCWDCHNAYDNGNNPDRTRVIKQMIRLYLESNYPGWDEENLKWKGKVYESR